MCLCVCVHVCVCVYQCVYMSVCVGGCMWMCTCMFACMCAHVRACVCAHACVSQVRNFVLILYVDVLEQHHIWALHCYYFILFAPSLSSSRILKIQRFTLMIGLHDIFIYVLDINIYNYMELL